MVSLGARFRPPLPWVAPSCTIARWVTRLYMLFDQFLDGRVPEAGVLFTTISMTPEWNDSVLVHGRGAPLDVVGVGALVHVMRVRSNLPHPLLVHAEVAWSGVSSFTFFGM